MLLLIVTTLANASVAVTCTCGKDSTNNRLNKTISCCEPSDTQRVMQSNSCCSSVDNNKKVSSELSVNNDCGTWSMMYIVKQLGISKDENQIRHIVQTDLNKGASMQDLVQGAKKLGLDAKGYKMSYAELGKRALPVIISFPNHFAVLVSIDSKNNTLIFADSNKPKYTLTKDEFLKKWGGYVLEIRKEPEVSLTQ